MQLWTISSLLHWGENEKSYASFQVQGLAHSNEKSYPSFQVQGLALVHGIGTEKKTKKKKTLWNHSEDFK